MKRHSKVLRLSKETLANLSRSQLSEVAGGIRLEPSSGTDWTQQSVCPSICYSDCWDCRVY